MESWRKVLRVGFFPQFSDHALLVLKVALETDDQRLVQGATTSPPPLAFVQDWPCDAACLVAYIGWKAEELETVGEVERFFAEACFQGDKLLGEPAACRWLLNWFDDTPRDEVRTELLGEINEELAKRAA